MLGWMEESEAGKGQRGWRRLLVFSRSREEYSMDRQCKGGDWSLAMGREDHRIMELSWQVDGKPGRCQNQKLVTITGYSV